MKTIIEEQETKVRMINDVIKMNPKKEALTIEKLKTFRGFEQKNEAELKEYLHQIHQMAVIVAGHIRQQHGKVIAFHNDIKQAA